MNKIMTNTITIPYHVAHIIARCIPNSTVLNNDAFKAVQEFRDTLMAAALDPDCKEPPENKLEYPLPSLPFKKM